MTRPRGRARRPRGVLFTAALALHACVTPHPSFHMCEVPDGVTCVTFSADGASVLLGTRGGRVLLHAAGSHAAVVIAALGAPLVAIAPAPQGGCFVATGDRVARIDRLQPGAAPATLPRGGGDVQVRALALAADGAHLAAGTEAGTVLVWPVGQHAGNADPRVFATGRVWPIAAVTFSRAGERVFAVGGDPGVTTITLATGEVQTLGPTRAARAIAARSRGLVCAAGDSIVQSGTGQEMPAHDGSAVILDLELAPDRYAVTLSSDGIVRAWDLERASLVHRLPDDVALPARRIVHLALDASARRLVTVDERQRVVVRDWLDVLGEKQRGSAQPD